MNLLTQILPVISTIYLLESTVSEQNDPLIDHTAENLVYGGVILLAVALVAVLRVFSAKVEHAIMFAVFLTIMLMAFFFIK